MKTPTFIIEPKIKSPLYKDKGGASVPDEIRTHDLQLRRLLLYPAELPGHGIQLYIYSLL